MDDHRINLPDGVPRPTLERLPRYLNYLKAKRAEGCERTSSAVVAQDLKLNAVQVRKDLAFVSSGKPRVGHKTQELIERLEDFLMCGEAKDAVLVGVGHLGQALLSYDGFQGYGLSIMAAFDQDARLCGREIHGKTVFPLDKLINLTSRLNALIGIIAVPAGEAQRACDMLVEAGIRGILNFAPAHLTVPEEVVVRNEDIAASMALLAGEIKARQREFKENHPA